MKLIGIIHAFVGYRESIEDYQPDNLVHPRDIIELIKNTYQFSQFPILHPGQQFPEVFTYSAGRFADGENDFGIGQLMMSNIGDVALTLKTEQSELVLNHLMALLDKNLGFKLQASPIQKTYLTNLVAEFNGPLEYYLSKLSRMETAINEAVLGQDRKTFKLKQLSFGDNPNTNSQIPTHDPFQLMAEADFVLQRRAGHSFTENRYYCSAPLSDRNLINALENIEAIAAAQ